MFLYQTELIYLTANITEGLILPLSAGLSASLLPPVPAYERLQVGWLLHHSFRS